jgi:serine/threonine protein kinase
VSVSTRSIQVDVQTPDAHTRYAPLWIVAIRSFYGAGVDEQSRAFLVTELMQGSLKTLLYNAAQTLEWNTRLVFARDVACGILYLHDTAGTVHRDLKGEPLTVLCSRLALQYTSTVLHLLIRSLQIFLLYW